MVFPTGSILDTSTYFNRLPIDFLKKYTIVESIKIEAAFKGSFKFSLGIKNSEGTVYLRELTGNNTTLASMNLCDRLAINELSGDLFVRIEALSDDSILKNIEYFALGVQETPVFISIVICTFKREEYIEKNINALSQFTAKNPEFKKSHRVVIVDNNRSLPKIEYAGSLKIIPNKNSGGSGGFTRGLIDSLDISRENHYCLFMDDDIIFDPQQLAEMQTIISLRKKDLIVGSPMLRAENPFTSLHERGGIIKKCFYPEFVNLDKDFDILKNNHAFTETKAPEYTAWWWFCFPVSICDTAGLPYPFFIKFDDVEYSKRLNRMGLDIAIPSNFGVWHEPSEYKRNPVMQYFLLRNNWIYHSLIGNRFSVSAFIKGYIKRTYINVSSYRYGHQDICNKAVKDFLSGPSQLFEDPEVTLQELIALVKDEQFKDKIPSDWYESDRKNLQESRLHKFFRVVFFNGLFLPCKGTVIVDDFSDTKMYQSFRFKRIFFFSPYIQKGYTVRKQFLQSIKHLFKCYGMIFHIMFKLPQANKAYNMDFLQTVSLNSWQRILFQRKIEK